MFVSTIITDSHRKRPVLMQKKRRNFDNFPSKHVQNKNYLTLGKEKTYKP